MDQTFQKRILVCPLDWGLGHATRSIPIINELTHRGYKVIIASSGAALPLLRREFPNLDCLGLPSYKATYSLQLPFMLSIFLQVPKFLNAIRREHRETQRIVIEKRIDAIVSDCRYGCWSVGIPSVLITHQVNLLMPVTLKFLEPIINYFNRRQIKKFSTCWIPDFSESRLTGALSERKDLDVRYIGMLSRLKPLARDLPKKYEVMAILSGPEPQRSQFESLLKKQLIKSGRKCLLVRGIPGSVGKSEQQSKVEMVDYLSTEELQQTIEQAGIIICRSGYSSVMDFWHTGGRIIFVPTPGQTEQEYLAKQLEVKGIAHYQEQGAFDLETAMKQSENYSGFEGKSFQSDLLREAIDKLLK